MSFTGDTTRSTSLLLWCSPAKELPKYDHRIIFKLYDSVNVGSDPDIKFDSRIFTGVFRKGNEIYPDYFANDDYECYVTYGEYLIVQVERWAYV